jgi:hypothetical protein
MREKKKLAERDAGSAHAQFWNAVYYRPLMGRPSSALRVACVEKPVMREKRDMQSTW